MAIYSVAQFAFAPVWGSLSDKYGRRPILLGSILFSGISMCVMAYATSMWWIFACRLFAGIFAANISTAMAYITDSTTEENRAKGMGIIGAGFGLGFIFGPALGGILAPYGYHVPILVAAGLAFFNFTLGWVILKEPLKDVATRRLNRRKFSFAAIGKALSKVDTATPIVLFFISTLAFTQLEVSFGFFVLDRYGYDAKEAGLLLALMGVVMVIIQGGLIGRLTKRYGERVLISTGLFLMGIGLVGAGYTYQIVMFAVMIVVVGIGHAFINPSLSSLVSKAAPKDEVGTTMGVYQSASALGRIVGPPFAGILYVKIGIAWPAYFAAIFALAGLIFAIMSKSTLQRYSQNKPASVK